MAKNDKKVSDLLAVIESKRKSVGVKPRAAWKSNGILKYDNGEHDNINVVGSINECVDALAYLLSKRSFHEEASKMLGVEYSYSGTDDYIHDIKLRATMILWDAEKKKLDLLESKLKDLRSEDARTADALSDITQELR